MREYRLVWRPLTDFMKASHEIDSSLATLYRNLGRFNSILPDIRLSSGEK
jgi:hypothetical protein